MLADASIHLTGILLLGPHLTTDNQVELLARARYRTKREIEKLVATVAPAPDVPAQIVPLRRAGAVEDAGDERAGTRPRNTWAAFARALAGPVRQLQPGTGAGQAPPSPLPATPAPHPSTATLRPSTTPSQPDAPLRYKVRFSADQAFVDLLEEARDLLQHELPHRDLVEVQRRALQLLVQQLRRRKHAATRHPRAPKAPPSGRHLPAALRRAVWQRDTARCTYVDERGIRCRETAGLEFHHLEPYARGGPTTEKNLALRCRSHNTLAAEQDFGHHHIQQYRRAPPAAPARHSPRTP